MFIRTKNVGNDGQPGLSWTILRRHTDGMEMLNIYWQNADIFLWSQGCDSAMEVQNAKYKYKHDWVDRSSSVAGLFVFGIEATTKIMIIST